MLMGKGQYIRIHKVVETYVAYYYQIKSKFDVYEFYFTSIANCARWLGVSYNAVKYCLRGDYTLCEGYTIEYVSAKPDERRFYIDPDKYRNPEVRKAMELADGGVGVFFPDR
jgi:hypothetical protein